MVSGYVLKTHVLQLREQPHFYRNNPQVCSLLTCKAPLVKFHDNPKNFMEQGSVTLYT
jgi:hypothetical protein